MPTARNTILCHHCGQDYARDYWALGSKADPCVCHSCRRDTNSDAADAPRWVPGAHVDEPSPMTVVSPARKRCRVCGGEWDGLIFGPPASKGSPLPFGICPSCGAKDDAYAATLTARVVSYAVPAPELLRPRRASDGLDD